MWLCSAQLVIKTKTKLDVINTDDLTEVQDYINDKSVANTRLAFRIRTEMVDKIPANFKNTYRVTGTLSDGLLCQECIQQEIMMQSHCLGCPAWADIREGLDMSKICDLVVFFRKLLNVAN